jgi:DNA-directed RNA polymerase specialized sigma24 family protein
MAALARLNPRNLEADFTDDVDGRLSDERQMREVLGVLERLAPQEQDVLALCAWGGLGYEEASSSSSASPSPWRDVTLHLCG